MKSEPERVAEAMDIAFGIIDKTEPRCARCGAPGEFRGGRCYGCIRLTQDLAAIRADVRAVRRALAPGMEEHIKPVLLSIEERLQYMEDNR
jgi:tRNA(Ile2) C34 agmatinyltransferase TiaS